ncbi:MAG: hypothetical protein JWQ09_792 [Segetibacter sp.]|nr:hypothetical protein [Segetibacter sp.]
MPNKSFSIYNSDDFTVEEGDQLVVEIATSHLACVVTKEKENKRAITAYELFSFNEDEAANFSILFQNISAESKILNKRLSSSSIYFNNEVCIPVPIFKFNKEISEEYLNVVFGEDPFSKIQFEHLPIEPGIMNVFRINEDRFNYLNENFGKVTYHHTYSNIIRRVAYKSFVYPSEFISIQFYNTFMIVIVLKEGNFHLIQSFTYETPEDVLYYLLNITQQLELFSEKLTLQISGMIDLDFQLYRELIKYFKNVMVQNVKSSGLSLNINEHPLHYFTPYFNLAL